MSLAATTPPRMLTLIMLPALATLSLNMFLPSLANMALDFEAEYALLTLAIAGYLGITAILTLIIGPFSDRYGRRPVMLVALTVFTVASCVCATTENVYVFLVSRVFQGAIIAGWGVALAVVRDTSEAKEAARRISFITMCMSLAPMLGPMVGGVLDELFGWRSNFIVYALFGAATLLLCWVDLGETNQHKSESFTKQFKSYPDLLMTGRYWDYAICMAFSTGGFYIFIAGVPLVAITLLGLSPAVLGIYMGLITVGFALGTFISGRLTQHFSLTTMMISGRVFATLGMIISLAFFLGGIINAYTLFGPVMLVGVGNGLTMPSANAGVLSIRPDLAGSAVGLVSALSVGIGAALTSITGAITTEESGGIPLITLMLVASLISLAASLHLKWLERS